MMDNLYIHLAGKKLSATKKLSQFLEGNAGFFKNSTAAPINEANPYDDTEDDEFPTPGKKFTLDDEDEGLPPDETDEFEHVPEPTEAPSQLDQIAKELREPIINGDSSAWNKLYKAFYPYVRSVVKNNLYGHKSNDDIDDIVLHAFHTLSQKIGDWKEGTGLVSWLKTIAINRCRTVASTRKTYRKNIDPHTLVDQPGSGDSGEEDFNTVQSSDKFRYRPDEILKRKEFLDDIQRMIKELPEEEGTALRMFVFDSKSLKEIAEEMGWNVQKVKSRLENARYYAREWFFKSNDYGKLFKFVLEESKDDCFFKIRRFKKLLSVRELK